MNPNFWTVRTRCAQAGRAPFRLRLRRNQSRAALPACLGKGAKELAWLATIPADTDRLQIYEPEWDAKHIRHAGL
ncbi:MAG: hypothetical protein L0Z50_27650, partial [Verrucomicrobiales bacterium]|nr:hypothetical protein [Verrucomicrobiales bacterium]